MLAIGAAGGLSGAHEPRGARGRCVRVRAAVPRARRQLARAQLHAPAEPLRRVPPAACARQGWLLVPGCVLSCSTILI